MGKCFLELKFIELVSLDAIVIVYRNHSIGYNSLFNYGFEYDTAPRGSSPEILFLECFVNHSKNLKEKFDNKCYMWIQWCYSTDFFNASPKISGNTSEEYK